MKRGFAPPDGALREQRITRRAVREASSGHPEDAKTLYLPGYPHVRAAGSRPDRQGGCAGDVPQVRGLAVSRKCGPRQAVRRLRDAASTCRTAAEDSRPRGTTMYLTSVQRCADLNRGFSLANAPTTRRQTRAPLFPRTWIWSRVCTPCQDFSCWGTGHGADVARARSSRGRFARPEGSIVSPGPSIAPPRPVSTLNRTDPPAGC